MTSEKREELKLRCGGTWKLVLRFLLAGETCSRREKSQAIAGPGHSIAVTSKGSVYTFGSNSSGQLGHGTTEEESKPRIIRFLIFILECFDSFLLMVTKLADLTIWLTSQMGGSNSLCQNHKFLKNDKTGLPVKWIQVNMNTFYFLPKLDKRVKQVRVK